MADTDRSKGLRWWGWLILGAVVLSVGLAIWYFGYPPTPAQRAHAVTVACRDARHLRRAGLLQEARAADAPIAAQKLRCRGEKKQTIAREASAASFREVGDQYLRAAKLTRAAKRSAEAAPPSRAQRRRERFFAHAQRVDVRRALKGYRRAFGRNPYDAGTGKGLTAVLALMPVPADAGADARCHTGRTLRRVHALDAAATVFAQALRTGRTSRCDPENELRKARSDRAQAIRHWRRGDASEQSGDEAAARVEYIKALRLDPSLTAAKTSLDATEPPDLRDATRRGQLAHAGHWIAGTAGTGKSVGDWLTGHEGALAVGAVLAALVALLLMYLLFLVTKSAAGRDVVGWFHLPRFCDRQFVLKPFAPDGSDTSTTVFAYWLGMPLGTPGAPGGEALDSPTPIEAWESTDEVDEFASLFEGQPGILAVLWAWLRRAQPRRETHFVGYALDRCEHGPGLRAFVKQRRGRIQGAKLWWATDLPGPPLIAEEQEHEARHALAVYAATWARGVAGPR